MGVRSNRIIVVKTNKDKKQFIEDCKKLFLIKGTDKFVGIDFEFNTNRKINKRYIGLMQIIFIFDATKYYHQSYEKLIYILDPNKLSFNDKNEMIKYILCSNVTKIFHGSDSLDYPHIYDDLLKRNNNLFIQFINHSIDTRFLCEISKQIMKRSGIHVSNRCSIYNALLDHKIIDNNMFARLEKMSSKINYNKFWLIDSLTSDQITYGAYDVMYLYDLMDTIVCSIKPDDTVAATATANDDNRTAISENHIFDPISLVNRLYRFHMLNRLGIITISADCKKTLDETYHDIRKTNPRIDDIDEKIMETFLITISHHGVDKIDIMIEDILSLDTIRKSILNCLRIYHPDIVHYIDPSTLHRIDKFWTDSVQFNSMKGKGSIQGLINLIKIKSTNHVSISTNCNES
jgi:hypothetical protein